MQAGRANEALEIARRLSVRAPQAPDAQQLLAMCLASGGDVDGAKTAFDHALWLAPGHPLILTNYAAMLRKSGRHAAALPLAEQLVQQTPASAKAWAELAFTARGAGMTARAVEAAQRAVELQPGLVLAWQALGAAARADGDMGTAAVAFSKVLELDPGQHTAWINLGAVQRLSGRPDLALSSYDQAVRQGVASPQLDHAKVGALLDAGRVEDARQLAQRIVAAHPEFVPALATLAELAWEHPPSDAGSDTGRSVFCDAIAKRPRDRDLAAAYVRFLLSSGDPEEALEQVLAMRAQGESPQLTLLEAHAYDALGRTIEAGARYAALLSADGDTSPTLLNAYSRHLLRAGDYARAADMAMRVTRIAPQDQQAWAYLATAWRMLGDEREFWLCDYEQLIGVVEIEPPPGFGNRQAFLEALIEVLEPLHQARREPLEQSLRGGSQTPGRLFGRPDPVIAAARKVLVRGVRQWLASLPADAAHPFLQRNLGSVRIGGSWSVKLWSAGSHANHIHSEGWMSSAFYVALPPSVRDQDDEGQAGAIQFGQPPVELGLEVPPRRVIAPRVGQLALFPSFMWHGTVPFHDDAPRMTIAFDMTPLREQR
nr:putative 2OG-Fe(II) oxygenase [Lysobacter sp. M15]